MKFSIVSLHSPQPPALWLWRLGVCSANSYAIYAGPNAPVLAPVCLAHASSAQIYRSLAARAPANHDLLSLCHWALADTTCIWSAYDMDLSIKTSPDMHD